jgi:hypothetical protein
MYLNIILTQKHNNLAQKHNKKVFEQMIEIFNDSEKLRKMMYYLNVEIGSIETNYDEVNEVSPSDNGQADVSHPLSRKCSKSS